VVTEIPCLAASTEICGVRLLLFSLFDQRHRLSLKVVDADARTPLISIGFDNWGGRDSQRLWLLLILADRHQFLAQALFSRPCTLVVQARTVVACFLVDACLLVPSAKGVLCSTCFIGVVHGFPLVLSIRQVARGLWRCRKLALAWVHVAPFFVAPFWRVVTLAIRVVVFLPSLACGTCVRRKINLLTFDVDFCSSRLWANTDATAIFFTPLLLLHISCTCLLNELGRFRVLLVFHTGVAVFATASSVRKEQRLALVLRPRNIAGGLR